MSDEGTFQPLRLRLTRGLSRRVSRGAVVVYLPT